MHSKTKKNASTSGDSEHYPGESELVERIGEMQKLLDSYQGSMFSVDRNYRYTAFNSSHKNNILATYGANIEIGHSLLEYITVQKDHEAAKQNLDRALAGEYFTEIAYSVEASGKEAFFDIQHTPIKDEKGAVTGVSVFSENTTELKKSNDSRKETEELYSNLFRDLSSIILVIDVETKSILNANQAACNFYGYSHSELTSLKISELAVLTEEEIDSRFQSIASRGTNQFQHTHRLANGETRTVDIYAGEVKFNDRRVNVAVVHDSSERKIAEDKLHEILENVQDAPYRRNLQTDKYDYISPAIEQLSGFTAEETISMATEAVLEHMHSDDLKNIEQVIVESMANPGKSYQVEYRFRHKITNQYRWFEDRFTTTLDRQGLPAFRFGSVRDITEHKRMEENKQEAEFRYRSLFEQSHDGIFILDFQGNHVAINQRAADMMGYSIEDMHGLSVRETSAELQQSQQVIQQLLDGESFPLYERLFKKKDGTIFPVEIKVDLVRDSHGTPLHIQSVVRDISERKLAEEKLRESEERWQFALEGTGDGVWDWNAKTNKVFFSSQWKLMLGFADEEIGDSLDEWKKRVHPDDLPDVLEKINQHFEGKSTQYNSEHRIRCKSGNYKWILDSGKVIEWAENKKPLRVIGTHKDITERKLAEEKIRDSEEKYRAFVEQSSDGIVFVDEQGTVIEWNRAIENLTGLKKEKAFGKYYWEIQTQLTLPELKQAPDFPEKLKTGMLNMIQTGSSPLFNHTNVTEIVTVTGEKKYIEQIAFPVKTQKGYSIRSLIRDVTERKIAEGKLRDSEERFRLLFERSQAIMLIIDPASGDIMDANPAAANYYGYSLDQLREMPINKINTLPPGTVYTERQHALREERNFFIFPHRLANGEMRTVEVHSSPINIQGRQVLFSIIHDITKRKIAEEKLIESEERFSTAFHSSQEAISISRISDGVYIDVNDAFCSIFEISRGQVIGRTSQELELWINPEQRNEILKSFENGKTPIFEVQYRARTGRTGFMQASMARINLAGDECLLIFGKDVTSRKLAEEKLRESEENYRTFVEQGFDGVMFVDEQGNIAEWNRAFELLSGLKKEDVVGKPYWDVRFQMTPPEMQTPETLERYKTNSLQMIQTGQSPFFNRIGEGELFTTSGERKIVEQIFFPVKSKNGFGIRSVTRDITTRKQAETALQAAHEELEQRVRERTTELQTAIASLEKAAHVKDEFLSIMGHELRTPLNVMLGTTQLLQEEVYGNLNEKQTKAVTAIENSGENLLKLLNNILDLSTLQNGNISVTIASCSLGDICRSVLKLTAAASEKKKQQVNFSITPEDIMAKTDGLRVQQILLNLQNNAIKFTPDGGKIGIDVTGNRENKLIKIIVWDTGIGIKGEDLPRLFQPFMQLDARLSREYEGSGLGLALSKQLAELFGGSIHVESVPGEGSRFTVTLPWME